MPINLLRLCGNRWLQLGMMTLVLAFAWIRGNHYRAEFEREKAGRAEDRVAYQAAQAEALQRAIEQKQKFERTYKELSDDADAILQVERADAMADARRYIAAHRVQCSDPAAQGQASRSGGTAADYSASSGDRSGGEAELVGVKARDIEVCTSNTLRLEAVRAWGLSLSKAQ